jgi:hypothetical protein
MKRSADMPRIRNLDNPDYAIDIIDGAKPIASQFATAAGFLTVLMVVTSAMEAPIQPQDLYATNASEMEIPSAQDPKLLCSIGDKIRGWIAVTAS